MKNVASTHVGVASMATFADSYTWVRPKLGRRAGIGRGSADATTGMSASFPMKQARPRAMVATSVATQGARRSQLVVSSPRTECANMDANLHMSK